MVVPIICRIFAAKLNETIETMSNEELRKQIYNPQKGVEKVVIKICQLFDTRKELNKVRFDHKFKLGGLTVKSVEREHSHSAILVHWKPDFKVSTTSDPFCSAYVLTLKEVNKLYNELKKIIN